MSRPVLGPTQPPVQSVAGLSGGIERPGREADPSPLSTAVVKKEQSYTSTTPLGRTACTEPQCLYSTAIPPLPLWAVRPVQSLSVCTRVRFLKFHMQQVCLPRTYAAYIARIIMALYNMGVSLTLGTCRRNARYAHARHYFSYRLRMPELVLYIRPL